MSHVPTLPEHGPLQTRLEDLLELLGRPHMLGILYAVSFLLAPPARFQDIQKIARTSPTTVSKRLKEAVAAGLLARSVYDENPPRVEYEVTARVRELDPVLEAMNHWCRRHQLFPADPPVDDAPPAADREAHERAQGDRRTP